ncbi:AAA family ATPase [Vagococcus bubulae]|uniref:ABC transporter ATP-binding protein n=1 Tax=Vagococcus bubulae TaxID=1977868 RepID=A0A429ZPN8_9ENTE|nr:AAA family ATPase [Vagococcus bubulae]RST95646.1 ABC transporter ATP-binding protein [Vagococcus bubulae]
MYIKQLHYDGVEEGYFPYNLPFIKDINNILFTRPMTLITGENGVGKSTFLEAIVELLGLNLEGGSKNNQFLTRETQSDLAKDCRLIRYASYPKDHYFYRAESFYNLTTDLDDLGVSDDLFERPLHSFSRGQSIKALVQKRFFGHGIYLFDEPETGLSLQSQLELMVMMNDLVKLDSQFIICTHSPILLMFPEADILEITEEGIKNTTLEESNIIEQWDMVFSRKNHFFNQLFDS